jgi:hypothetical protein
MLILVVSAMSASSQTGDARISGRVTDQSDAAIVGADCRITNIETNVSITTFTNDGGIYVIAGLRPAIYRLIIQTEGIRTVVQPSLQLYVQDAVNENFTLAIGLRTENITIQSNVTGLQTPIGGSQYGGESAVRGQHAAHGRSFQSLIAVVPGVVFTSRDLGPGQFSVNGQRSNSNYFTVHGVGVNFGVQIPSLGQALGGAIPGFASVDDMQEFRIQTSSHGAELGRTPGALAGRSSPQEMPGTPTTTLYSFSSSSACPTACGRWSPIILQN